MKVIQKFEVVELSRWAWTLKPPTDNSRLNEGLANSYPSFFQLKKHY